MAVGTCIDSSTSLSDSSSNTVSPFGIDDKNKVDLLKVKKGQSYSKRFDAPLVGVASVPIDVEEFVGKVAEVAPAVTVPKRSFDTDLQDLLGLDSNSLQYEYNLTTAELFQEAIKCDRGRTYEGGGYHDQKAYATSIRSRGPLIFYTDPDATGRRVKDTFAAAYPDIEDKVWWKSDFSKYDPEKYEKLLRRAVDYLNKKHGKLYVEDVFVGRDPSFAIPFRFVGEYATHALFAKIMFPKNIEGIHDPDEKRWTLLNVPSFLLDPQRDGSRSDAAVIVDFRRRIALVAGPADYCGSIKKTMFTVMNYLLPDLGYLSMHSAANVGEKGDSAVLFGLSGTGKTTLSADPDRQFIGDDEIAWTDAGISNIEDGCYAKLIDLDKKAEPVIAAALSMPATIVENVPPLPGRILSDLDPQELDLADSSITENTRFAYGLECNPQVMEGAKAGHPKTVVFLTADAFGVLPPISLLDKDDAMYHFVTGYSSKIAGTEVGVTEPKATFSACFGAPFMSRFPSVYANLLAKKIGEANTRCILLNTGWSGGAYGTGKRMSIRHTRALLNSALAGELDNVDTEKDPNFGLCMPKSCPGVLDNILNPRNTWDDKEAYDKAARKLRDMFRTNFREKGLKDLGIKEVV